MPTRVLRDWTDSEKVNSLSMNAEVLFVRLIMKADDYGRYTANPRLIKNLCFPLKDGLRDTDISRLLTECEKAGLLAVYHIEEKPFLEILNFKQRTRANASKYPPPDGKPQQLCLTYDGQVSDNCQTDVRHPRTETETETETNNIVNTGNELPAAGDESPSVSSAAVKPSDLCPHEQIIEAWHEIMPELARIRVWSEASRSNLRARWREDSKRQSVDWWRRFFKWCRASDFLMGKSGNPENPFRFTLNWLICPKNFEKVANERYHQPKAKPAQQPEITGSTFA